MSAERTPRSQDSLLSRLLVLLTRLVLSRYRVVVLAAVALALLSAGLTARYLGMRTSRLDLLNPNSQFNQRWMDYLEEFGDADDVVIVVEGEQPTAVLASIDFVAETIQKDPVYADVFYKFDLSAVQRKGLHYLPVGELERLEKHVTQMAPLLRGEGQQLAVLARINALHDQLASDQARYEQHVSTAGSPASLELAALAEDLNRWLSDTAPDTAGLAGPRQSANLLGGLPQLPDSGYLLSDDGRLGFILLRLAKGDDGFAGHSSAIADLRRLLAQVQQQRAGVRIGLTGLPVIESDEMRTSQRDMLVATLLSLVGVVVLFLAGFGGLRYPLMTVLALGVGMAWSFGFATVAVGHLNILSISFGAILIGLGVDFGIHYIACYVELRKNHGCVDALQRTAAQVGPGVVTGAVTTALAFGAAALTDFTGVAELGIIAGGGILLCMLAALFVLPALIRWWDERLVQCQMPSPLPTATLCHPVSRYPRTSLALMGGITAVLSVGLIWLRFDHNLLNMQPKGLESVAWERQLLSDAEKSAWFAVSVAQDPQDLLRRKALFQQLPSVGRTEEIVSLVPAEDPQRAAAVQRLRDQLQDVRLPEVSISGATSLLPSPAAASPDQILLALRAAEPWLRAAPQAAQAVRQLHQTIEQLPGEYVQRRLDSYQRSAISDIASQLGMLRLLANAEQPTAADLPAEVCRRFIGQRGTHLLRVYARGSIWETDKLQRFVRDLERVDPEITGHPVQAFYASRQMQRSYLHAGLYALLAVAAALMLDFRSIRHALLSLMPMGVGLLQMFGLLGWLDIPLNPANMIVLPLILGIGIDDGVHVLHDYLRQRGKYVMGHATATAIIMTSSTTMMGFGAMMCAQHEGLRSLGQVLTLGVFCCLTTSLVTLPAMLSWHADATHGEPAAAAPIGQRLPPLIRPRRLRLQPHCRDGSGPATLHDPA